MDEEQVVRAAPGEPSPDSATAESVAPVPVVGSQPASPEPVEPSAAEIPAPPPDAAEPTVNEPAGIEPVAADIAAATAVAAGPATEPGSPPDQAQGATVATKARGSRRRAITRFALAFVFGLLAVLAVAAGALAAYETSTQGRILPGVHVGSVDLSGLTQSDAAARLRAAYAAFGDGQLVLSAAGTERTVSYADLGRRVDVDTIVARAMAIGRGGPTVERIASNVRILVRGTTVEPVATVETAALRYEIDQLATAVDATPVDASVTTGADGFVVNAGIDGRTADVEAALRAAESLLSDPDAPSSVKVEIPMTTIAPTVTTDEAKAASDAADRIATDITLVDGGRSWTIPGADIRGWISFQATADGGYGPVVAQEGLETGLAAPIKDVAVAPVSATFLLGSGNKVVGVSAAKEGQALDVPGTLATIAKVVDERAQGAKVDAVPLSITTIDPELSTEEATKTAPLMQPISEWRTYFPIGISNGSGANIWIPARNINGQVVLPGQWFDFWKAIGPVTRAAGYKDGGVIVDGHSEPTGALAGGICSCSTTLFNAALRAGLQMGARLNHYYYINRYPLGLDATVFQSSSGSIQTMSFRNDTDHPILIKSVGWSVGSRGYVKFIVWSVPTGRTVTFSKPIVKNVRPASDSVVYTTALAPGVRKRVEYPVDGMDVWVTRTVTDASGAIVHQETYYSHYARITGVVQVGAPKT
jgi:vancomycin resistance protein YoaR